MQLSSLIIYNSLLLDCSQLPTALCNSAVAFLFALIRFQHSYGYQAQAQIATSARMDILRVQMFTQCEMTAEMSIQREGGREE